MDLGDAAFCYLESIQYVLSTGVNAINPCPL